MILAVKFDSKIVKYFYLICLSLLILPNCQSGRHESEPVFITGSTMGTSYNIKFVSIPPQVNKNQIEKAVNSKLEEINLLMSSFLPDSEVSKFNDFEKTNWFSLSPQTWQVVSEAHRISIVTGGAFDITVAPLVKIWGFNKNSLTMALPDEKDIEKTLEYVGFNKIQLNSETRSLKKLNPKTSIDLSAIAKGFAVDEVALLLEKLKIKDYLVEIGGEIKISGFKGDKTPWIVAIEKPLSDQRAIQSKLILKNMSMATSGDYRNYFEIKGKRYSHTIDPVNGMTISHNLASVSVIDNSCMKADALATALMVMGEKKGFALALKEKLAVFFIVRTEKGFKTKYTPFFKEYLMEE